MTIFEGKRRQTTKINITFSMGNEVSNIVLTCFLQKGSYRLNESQKTGFEAHFPPYQWFYWADYFHKQ